MKMLKKRTRSSNFTQSEEDILLHCVLRHVAIVESKKTDSDTLKEKHRAWEQICIDFNTKCPHVTRNIKTLKDKYTNVKTSIRKKLASRKEAESGDDDRKDWLSKSKALADLVKFISTSAPEPLQESLSWSSADAEFDPFMVCEPKVTPVKLSKTEVEHFESRKNGKDDSVRSLKRKLLEKELEMREIEHQIRLRQQQKEHEARLSLLEAQKRECDSKVKLRMIKISILTDGMKYEVSETDSE